jgi:hypothetical protein
VEWEAQLAKLAVYKAAHGDCGVPQGWAEDPGLGTWASYQRQLKKRLDRGGASGGMSAARVAKLEALGFDWAPPLGAAGPRSRSSLNSSNGAAWEAQLARLAVYKAAHGDCGVPHRWAEEEGGLGQWVGTQRYCKKALDRGDPSPGITAARVAKLEALGFVWGLKHYGPRLRRTQAGGSPPQKLEAADPPLTISDVLNHHVFGVQRSPGGGESS